jgi:small subunit ribosomal protein S20
MAKGKKVMRHASALKAHRKSLARKADNYQVRSKVRTLTQNVLKAIQSGDAKAAKEKFLVAQSAWQKAAKKGVFHANAAARKIGNLATRIASIKS